MRRQPTTSAAADEFEVVRSVGLALSGVEAGTRYDGSPVLKLRGVFLAGLIGTIAVLVGGLLLNSKNPETIHAVNKEISTFLVIYALFGMLVLLGVHFAVSGLWMLVVGKRSRVLLWFMWAILFAVWVTGGIVVGLTGG